jgi:hypothetical protein
LAWRVRDALARHPLLGGSTANITVVASREAILLQGWVLDDGVHRLAVQIAARTAGPHVVQPQLSTGHCPDEVRFPWRHPGQPQVGQLSR